MIESKYVEQIAQELAVRPQQVCAAIELLSSGATMPFVARYRKDVTGNLNEEQLETIGERNNYFIGLGDRRRFVLDTIEKQGQLTDELRAQIEAADDKTTLEDLYLPFKKTRRTKASVAREQGLEPLADFLWAQSGDGMALQAQAAAHVSPEKGVASPEAAIEGAQHILAERIATYPPTRQRLREQMVDRGQVKSSSTKAAEGKKTKYETYYDFAEAVRAIPSHRFLAICRGEKEGLLRMELMIDDEAFVQELEANILTAPGTPFEPLLKETIRDAYQRLLRPSLENEVLGYVRERSEEEAIRVFRENAENLLLSSPAGRLRVIGIDPGMRTGCKLAVISDTGEFLDHAVIYPNEPQNDLEGAGKTLLEMAAKHNVQSIAIGNGTGAREAARFVKQVLAKAELKDSFCVFVNEAGASVYSASKLAREEFPELDVTIRGAISIARRLQDPLAELVKIEPRSIGVGQYQHDVNQKNLREGLQRTVSYCVNRVGVDVNTASVALLHYVSGIQANTAENLVKKRDEIGGFSSREQFNEVDGVGPKVFQQCAGFLRISGAPDPLDSTSIHPEAYPTVREMAAKLGVEVAQLVGQPELLANVRLEEFQHDEIGLLTLQDIRLELSKPGRDPRKEFRVPTFLEGVDSVAQLEEGMDLEGVVTNVTDFGAFVDIGVHHDGLVHLSELSNRYVHDAREVVKVGDIVKVRVLKVDKELPRISLSMKALQPQVQRAPRPRPEGEQVQREGRREGAPAEGGQKPRREASERPRRPKRDKQKESRGRDRDTHKPAQQKAPQEKLNTLLADQLAGLRDKFNS
jgi:uncharacterized protein